MMAALLRLVIPAFRPSPHLGGVEIVGGCIAFALEPIHHSLVRRRDHLTALRLPDDLEAVVRRLMARRRDHLAACLRQPPGQPYDPEAHKAELREEKGLVRLQSDLAKQKGVATSTLVDALVAEANTRVDQAVEDGKLTAEQAATVKAGAKDRITAFVNGRMPRFGDHHRGLDDRSSPTSTSTA